MFHILLYFTFIEVLYFSAENMFTQIEDLPPMINERTEIARGLFYTYK